VNVVVRVCPRVRYASILVGVTESRPDGMAKSARTVESATTVTVLVSGW
jgi:hypothetical protein